LRLTSPALSAVPARSCKLGYPVEPCCARNGQLRKAGLPQHPAWRSASLQQYTGKSCSSLRRLLAPIFGRNLYPLIWRSAARLAGAAQNSSIWSVRRRWPPVVSCRVGRDEAGHCGARWWLSLSLARSDLRPRRTKSADAGGDSILAEMMELGRWGDERHRQVRGFADRPPGVAHGGGDYIPCILSRPGEVNRNRLLEAFDLASFSAAAGSRGAAL
jgi:hypothetical protein